MLPAPRHKCLLCVTEKLKRWSQLKCDGTRAGTRFRLSAKLTSPFKSAGGVSSIDCWQSKVCGSVVLMLDTPCSEVVWRVLATHCIRQFPLHFPSRSSPCAITLQLDCTLSFSGPAVHGTEFQSFQIRWLTDWLICDWVRDRTVPMHLGLNWWVLCVPYRFMGALLLY